MSTSDLTPLQRSFVQDFILGRIGDASLEGDAPEAALGQAMQFLAFQARFATGGDATLDDVLESGKARAICAWANDLDGPAREGLMVNYIAARKAIGPAESQVQGILRQNPGARLDIEAALDVWEAMPRQPVNWFMAFLAQTLPAPSATETDPDGLAGSVQRLLARAPLADVDATQIAEDGTYMHQPPQAAQCARGCAH